MRNNTIYFRWRIRNNNIQHAAFRRNERSETSSQRLISISCRLFMLYFFCTCSFTLIIRNDSVQNWSAVRFLFIYLFFNFTVVFPRAFETYREKKPKACSCRGNRQTTRILLQLFAKRSVCCLSVPVRKEIQIEIKRIIIPSWL